MMEKRAHATKTSYRHSLVNQTFTSRPNETAEYKGLVHKTTTLIGRLHAWCAISKALGLVSILNSQLRT